MSVAKRQLGLFGSPRYHIRHHKHWLGSLRVCFHQGDRDKLPRVYRTRYTPCFFFYKLPANNLQFSAALKISPAPRVLSFQFPSQPSVFIRFTAIPSYCQLWPISIRRIFFGATPTYRGSLVKIHARPRLFNTIEVQFRSINFDHVLENNTVSMGSFHPFIDSICVFFFLHRRISVCLRTNDVITIFLNAVSLGTLTMWSGCFCLYSGNGCVYSLLAS